MIYTIFLRHCFISDWPVTCVLDLFLTDATAHNGARKSSIVGLFLPCLSIAAAFPPLLHWSINKMSVSQSSTMPKLSGAFISIDSIKAKTNTTFRTFSVDRSTLAWWLRELGIA